MRRHITRFVRVTIALFCVIMLSCANVGAQSDAGPAKQSFVPVDQLEAIFQSSPNGILLPKEEFQELLSKAQTAQQGKSVGPVSFVSRSATYEVRQQGNHAVVSAELQMEQFADEWLVTKIPVGNLLVESATIDGEAAAVFTQSHQPGLVFLAHREPGRFVLNLTMSTPLATVGTDQIAAFRTVPAMGVSLKVACPKDRQLRFNDLKLNRPAPIEQATEYSVPVGNVDEVRLKWSSPQQTSDAQSLVFARTVARIQLSQGDIRWTSDTRVSVFGAAINQLIARVPSRLEVTAVDSAGLESWKLEDDLEQAGATRVVLNYRQPFTEDRVVKVSAVATTDQGGASANLPTLEFVDVTSHTGRLFVQHEEQLRLMASVEGGVRHLGTNRNSGTTTSGEMFDFWMQDFVLSVAVKPRDRELFAEVNSTLSIVDTLARFRCKVTVESLNAPLFELPLQLPPDWQISSVTAEDGGVLKWRNGDSANQIVVDPNKRIAAGGLFGLTVNLSQTIDDPIQLQTIELPVVIAENALMVGGTYEISNASDLIVSPVEIDGLAPIGAEGSNALFETQGVTYSGKVTVVRKPVRLSSRSVIRSWMDTRQKTVEAIVTVDVLNGTTRTLQLQVPEDLGEEVRFSVLSITKVPGCEDQQVPTAVAIVEQTAEEVVDDARRFSLTFDKRFLGAVTLKTTIRQPVTEDTTLSAAVFGVNNAIRQHGLVVFEAYPEQQLAAATPIEESGLSIADAGLVEPPAATSSRRVALVYRYIQPEYSLKLTEQRFETQAVPSAVCERMLNVSLLSDTGSIQRSCKSSFRCIGVQTLRFSLPDADRSYLWSTMLDGEAIEVRRDDDAYLVAIPTENSQSLHELEILFETKSLKKSLLGKTAQRSVSLSIDSDQGQASPIDILKQTWDVRYPATAMLMNHEGGFTPKRKLDEPGWLKRSVSYLRIPTSKTLFNQGVPIAIFFLALFVLTNLIVRRSWKTLACLVLLVIVAIPFTLQNSREFARVAGSVASKAVTDDAAATVEDDPFEISLGENLAGGTDMMFGVEPDASPQPSVGSDGFMGGGAGFGGGGFGGGGQYGGRGLAPLSGYGAEGSKLEPPSGIRADVVFPLAVPSAEDDFAGRPPEPAVPTEALANTQARGTNRVRFGVLKEFELTPSVPDFDSDEQSQQLSGAARLSVHARIAKPNDYKTMPFHSIGGTPAAGNLEVTVQPQSRMTAIRWIVAAFIALLCLMMNKSAVRRRVVFVIFLLLVAAAAIPLVPNEWQSAVDGVACGVGVGVLIWLVLGIFRALQRVFEAVRPRNRIRLLRSRPAKVVGLLMIASLSNSLANADENNKLVRPEVVMPYTPGQPELLADQVFLPQSEFLKLYELAYPDSLSTPATPSASQVVGAFYKSGDRRQIEDANWSQSFKVRYVIRSFSSQPVDVDLPIGNVSVTSAKIGDQDAVLVANVKPTAVVDHGSVQQLELAQQQAVPKQNLVAKSPSKLQSAYKVRIPSEGVHLLDVDFAVAAAIENSVGKVLLPLRPVASGTMVFELPDGDSEARVNGRSNVFRADGKTITIPIALSGQTTIEWKPAATQAASDTIYHSLVTSALIMDDRGLVLKSDVSLNCRQGQVSEVQLAVPPEYSVQSVEGSDVAGWKASEDDAEKLSVLFRQPIDGETKIRLTLFQRTIFGSEDQTIEVPVPAVIGASRDSGSVSVLAGRELEIRVDSLSGVSQVNAADVHVPDSVEQETIRKVLAWRYTRQPVAISVRVFRTADRMKIASLNGVQLEAQRQLWTTMISAEISGAPRRRLEIKIPGDYLALDVAANDMADWYYSDLPPGSVDSADSKILNIQFQTAKLGVINVVVQGQTSRKADESVATLVAPSVLAADECLTSVSVWLDAASEIATATADGWKRAGRESAIDRRILALQSDAPDISFQSDLIASPPIALALRKAEASLRAESVYLTTVTDTSIESTLALKWNISGAATRSVSFTIPAEFGEVYDFAIPGLRQVKKTIEGESLRVTVHLQQPASGSLFVLGTGTLPLPDSQQVSVPRTQFVVGPEDSSKVASQSHFWVIVNQSAGLLESVDASADADDVAAEAITTAIPDQILRQAVAIRRLKPNQPNSAWQVKFPERQKVAPAVVALASHVTVVAKDSTWRSLHTLQVRNESRQFLPVVLPDDSRVLSCLVKGQPTRVVTRTQGEQLLHLIPIPQSGDVSVPFNVEFSLAGQLPQMGQDVAGELVRVPCPIIPDYRDFPDYGVTISRNTWQVYVPEEWQASMVDDPRQTNVIAASLEDVADVRLMCSVDNMKSMISAANISSVNGNAPRVFRELQRQQSELQDLFGNDAQTETERTRVLSEAQSLLQGQSLDDDNGRAAGQQAGKPSMIFNSTMGSNVYLDQQEATSNAFSNTNRLQIIEGNSGSGVKFEGGSISKFNFELPPLVNYKSPSDKSNRDKSPAVSSKSGGRLPSAKGGNSKLLQRRQSNQLQSLQELGKSLGQSSGNSESRFGRSVVPEAAPAFGSRQLSFPATQNDPATLNLRGQVDVQSVQDLGVVILKGNQADVNVLGNLIAAEEQQQALQQKSEGLLSLQFSIPDAGIRYDFVRTGGNSNLTLKVRSRNTVNLGIGIGWAVFCAVVLFVLLRGASKDGYSLVIRLLFFVSLIGLAGAIFASGPVRDVCFVTCLAAAFCACVLIVVRSLRTPVIVAE